MKALYKISLLIQDEDQVYHCETSWLIETSEEELIKKLEKYNQQFKEDNINGILAFNKLPDKLDLKDFTYEKIVEDIENL